MEGLGPISSSVTSLLQNQFVSVDQTPTPDEHLILSPSLSQHRALEWSKMLLLGN